MQKFVLFVWLYLYSLVRYVLFDRSSPPKGVHGYALFMFVDVNEPPVSRRSHGVVVFCLPPGMSLDQHFRKDLYGPFGFSSEIDWRGYHLYGLDTWGSLNPTNEEDRLQIAANPELAALAERYPGWTFQLAGVRKIFGRHIWPLNKAERFVLPRR